MKRRKNAKETLRLALRKMLANLIEKTYRMWHSIVDQQHPWDRQSQTRSMDREYLGGFVRWCHHDGKVLRYAPP